MTLSFSALVNADIWCCNKQNQRKQAIAWANERIVAVGTNEQIRAAVGADATIIDAKGASVTPGYIDAHHHASIVALYGGVLRVGPPGVTNIETLKKALTKASRGLKEGQWLVVTGWDESLFDEKRSPTLQELDDAVPNHPLFALHYTCHRAAVNTHALRLAGISKNTTDPSGGKIERNRSGVPTGLLIERAMSSVEKLARQSLLARDCEGFYQRLGEHYRNLLAVGITRLVDATVPTDLFSLYHEAANRGLISIPTHLFPVSTKGYLEAPWDALDGPPTGETKGPITVGPVKMVFDGAPGCAMCLSWWQSAGSIMSAWALALKQGNLDAIRTTNPPDMRLGRQIRTGITIFEQKEASAVVNAALDRGFGLAIHAIGNEAINTALNAYEQANQQYLKRGIPRLEHATFLDDRLTNRIATLGAAVVTQPYFLSLPMYHSTPKIPGLRNMPLKSLVDRGVLVAASSDYPVAGYDPIDGIYAAITRKTERGRDFEGNEKVTLQQALTMYTHSAAVACGCDQDTGSLDVNKRADLVLLDRPIERLTDGEKPRVAKTIVAGKVEYSSEYQ